MRCEAAIERGTLRTEHLVTRAREGDWSLRAMEDKRLEEDIKKEGRRKTLEGPAG